MGVEPAAAGPYDGTLPAGRADSREPQLARPDTGVVIRPPRRYSVRRPIDEAVPLFGARHISLEARDGDRDGL